MRFIRECWPLHLHLHHLRQVGELLQVCRLSPGAGGNTRLFFHTGRRTELRPLATEFCKGLRGQGLTALNKR
jgi:hypothetical protein